MSYYTLPDSVLLFLMYVQSASSIPDNDMSSLMQIVCFSLPSDIINVILRLSFLIVNPFYRCLFAYGA